MTRAAVGSPTNKLDPWLAGAMHGAGVTRVARVTGLDRTGVEVACAIRPTGHVLQVTNGKGATAEDARRSALMEAVELAAAERVDPAELVWASAAELIHRAGDDAVWPPHLGGSAGPVVAPELGGGELRRAWRLGRDLLTGQEVFVPATLVHCPPPDGPALGPAVASWTSNGMGAHPEHDRALEHALLEVIERDQLARALPEGWTDQALRERLVDRRWVARHAPRTAEWVTKLEANGFGVAVFDLSTEVNTRPPVAAALLFDRDEGPVPFTIGYAARFDPDEALLSALFEAAQSRLTDIHGAREDISEMPAEDVGELRAQLARARAGGPPRWRRLSPGSLLPALKKEGVRHVVEVAIEAGVEGVEVVKVLVPRFELSELL